MATPDVVGLDPATLCGIGPHFQTQTDTNIHSVLLVRHGKLVYERYFTGLDEHLGRSSGTVAFNAETKHDLRSITKSVVSLVLGIEVGKGRIAGVDQKVMPLLPEYADLRTANTDEISIRDLLTMSLGFAWNEDLPYNNPDNSETRMDEAADPVRYILSRPVEAPPGTVFNYSGGAAMIIGRLLHKATGQNLDALARTELFEPLGIETVPNMGVLTSACGRQGGGNGMAGDARVDWRRWNEAEPRSRPRRRHRSPFDVQSARPDVGRRQSCAGERTAASGSGPGLRVLHTAAPLLSLPASSGSEGRANPAVEFAVRHGRGAGAAIQTVPMRGHDPVDAQPRVGTHARSLHPRI